MGQVPEAVAAPESPDAKRREIPRSPHLINSTLIRSAYADGTSLTY